VKLHKSTLCLTPSDNALHGHQLNCRLSRASWVFQTRTCTISSYMTSSWQQPPPMRSQQKLETGVERVIAVHIRAIAACWNAGSATIFCCWGEPIWSKDFLVFLVEHAPMVSFEQGRGMLPKMSNCRDGLPRWLPFDCMLLSYDSGRCYARSHLLIYGRDHDANSRMVHSCDTCNRAPAY
jgi:hypothetical protein